MDSIDKMNLRSYKGVLAQAATIKVIDFYGWLNLLTVMEPGSPRLGDKDYCGETFCLAESRFHTVFIRQRERDLLCSSPLCLPYKAVVLSE